MNDFLTGAIVGMGLFAVLHWIVRVSYDSYLTSCAKSETSVNIDDRFYYVVPEHVYVQLRLDGRRSAQ